MNLLEHYIKKILSVKKVIPPIPVSQDCVTVKMIVNCHGTVAETEMLFFVDEWEDIKKQGFYMA